MPLMRNVVSVRRGSKLKEEIGRTKETKVPRMNDRFGIYFACTVVQGREMTTDISNAEYSAMDGVYKFCLGVDLVGPGTGTRAG
jgi:hypothetical protein